MKAKFKEGIINFISFLFYLHIDIFVTCNWFDTRWQQYSTHLHTDNTQNDTIYLGRVRTVPRLGELYPGICLTTEEKHGKTSVRVAEECQLAR